jgi:hypothetical protein
VARSSCSLQGDCTIVLYLFSFFSSTQTKLKLIILLILMSNWSSYLSLGWPSLWFFNICYANWSLFFSICKFWGLKLGVALRWRRTRRPVAGRKKVVWCGWLDSHGLPMVSGGEKRSTVMSNSDVPWWHQLWLQPPRWSHYRTFSI